MRLLWWLAAFAPFALLVVSLASTIIALAGGGPKPTPPCLPGEC